MHARWRFFVGAGLIVAAIGYLIVTAVRNTAEYYLTVNEVKSRQGELGGQMLRVAGRVAPGSIAWNPITLTLSFGLAEPPPADQPGVKSGCRDRDRPGGLPRHFVAVSPSPTCLPPIATSSSKVRWLPTALSRRVRSSPVVPRNTFPSSPRKRDRITMALIGQLALALALVLAAYSIIANVVGARSSIPALTASARHALWAMCAMVTVAVGALWTSLLHSDFSLEYVASYTSFSLPTVYKITALWGGQQGSLLFWTWLLTIFTSIVAFQNRRRNSEITPYALAVLAGLAIFFLGMLNFVTRPFELLAVVPNDGQDLNPLLQNYWMAIHPPSLYTGYVSASVPFAFGVGALIAGRLDDSWIRSTRRWAIFSWFFLTLGNMFGARWAYEVLGWGGYWAWDPVENAAFMPWLVMTAYLHSVMIQERKDMLKVWNLVLIGMAFGLTLFGTFITRSGVISSVHSFTQSGLGPYFLTFLLTIVVLYTGLLLSRVRQLRTQAEFESYLSREAAFLFNNLVLVGIAFAVFWGTLLSRSVRGGSRREDHCGTAFLRQSQRTARSRAYFSDGGRTADRMAAIVVRQPREDFHVAGYLRGHHRRLRVRRGVARMVRPDRPFARRLRPRHDRRRISPRGQRAPSHGFGVGAAGDRQSDW